MSLLDGLSEMMRNDYYDSLLESDIESDLDASLALEKTTEEFVELSDADISAIFDDSNPDNIASDISIDEVE